MRTINLPDDVEIFNLDILDSKNNILLCIYQINKKFAYRYLTANPSTGEKFDPIFRSDKFNFARGLFDSPIQAKNDAKSYYLSFGLSNIKTTT